MDWNVSIASKLVPRVAAPVVVEMAVCREGELGDTVEDEFPKQEKCEKVLRQKG